MRGKPFVEIPNLTDLAERYLKGESVPQICEGQPFKYCTLRRRFIDMGIMRSRKEGIAAAFASGRMANRRTRKGVPQSEAAKRKQSYTMRRKADAFAKETRINSKGYVEFTRKDNPNFGRLEHVVLMEQKIGRKLLKNECVHHVDENKTNNDLSNLVLMTISEHTRLHRYMEAQKGKNRERDENGRFS